MDALLPSTPHPVLDPGIDEVAHVWEVRDPGSDGPLVSGILPGGLVTRARRMGGDCVVGPAHLWLRYLPVSFISRMACVCMRWADAAMPLRTWREEMEERRQAFAQFGVPDERLLVPPLTAEEEVQARRRAAEVAREEALILRMEERCEDAAAAAAEFEALRSMPGLSDGFLAHLDEVEAEGARGRR